MPDGNIINIISVLSDLLFGTDVSRSDCTIHVILQWLSAYLIVARMVQMIDLRFDWLQVLSAVPL